jgi:hypothetical protein
VDTVTLLGIIGYGIAASLAGCVIGTALAKAVLKKWF